MGIFDKCQAFTKADDVKKLGLYPYFHVIKANEGPIVKIDGNDMYMAGSNNYLGLTTHPYVIEAAVKATEKYGTGCSGSRYLTGNLDLHVELEAKLAKFLNKEAVLLFSTGYQTSQGVVSTLVQKGEHLICDKEDHASIMASAIMAKGAMADFVRYKHSDMKDLEKILSSMPLESNKLIVTDGVFSVTGEICNLPEINRLAKQYNAVVLEDDAHGVGVIGKGGRGTPDYFNQVDETDMIMGTFSKTFASLGGFVAAPERVINYIKHNSPALIFSASPTPASCAAALASLEILEKQPELVEKLRDNTNYMRDGFRKIGFEIISGDTAIIPVIIGDMEKALLFWRRLFDSNVYVNAFVPPGVPPNMSMMRTSYMATHEKHHLDYMLDVFEQIGKEFGLLDK
ncbi:MAG: aminotransferase class I/II-fold pyridoxal phosphate-dependent enzyme [bacterium]